MHIRENEKLAIFTKDGHSILDVSSEGCTLLSDEDERIFDVCIEVEKLEDGTVEELYDSNLLAGAWYSGETPGEVGEGKQTRYRIRNFASINVRE